MKPNFLQSLLLLGVSMTYMGSLTSAAQELTLPQITQGEFYARSAGNGFRSLPSGTEYTIQSQDKTQILKCDYKTGKVLEILFDSAKARECNFTDFDDYLISDNGLHIILLRETSPIYRRSRAYTAYHYDVRRNLVSPLGSTAEGQIRIPTFSPNGRMLAYVRNNDIYIKKFDYNTEVRVTTDGRVNHVMSGVTDWVYEEELYATNLMAWSNDSRYLAYVRTDESEVKMYGMTLFGNSNYPRSYDYKYPKAGEQNATVSLHLYHTDNRSSVPVLEKELSTEPLYIPRIEFVNGTLYAYTLNRNQNNLRVYQINPDSHVSKLFLQDKAEKYIDTNSWVLQMKITPDGAYYVHDATGRPQVYKYSTAGTLEKQLTSQNADITEFYGVSASGEIYYAVAEPTPMDRTIWAMDARGRARRLSPERGTSKATFSANHKYYLLSHSTTEQVPHYGIFATANGKEQVMLEDNAELARKISQTPHPTKEFITVRTKDGQELNAWIIKPRNFVPSRKYPMVMTQYSGPGSQEVLNEYSLGWNEYLAEQGFIVACVDGRGTGARGSEFMKSTYLRMGVLESTDQIEAAQALGELPYVDEKNIGIFGWSFGGYNVLMAMTRGEGTFQAGVAVAPPTDWRLYDSIYTERYMRTPQENPKGYEETSVMTHVDGLKGNLLIVQGSADDNVHMQNTMLLVPHLVSADKDYSMLVYTDKDHGIHGDNTRNQLYRQITNYFILHLVKNKR